MDDNLKPPYLGITVAFLKNLHLSDYKSTDDLIK